jgi:hypothetical protein
MSASLRKASILFTRARQAAARSKSTYVYEVDKTFAQRWLDKKANRVKELQKFHGVSFL